MDTTGTNEALPSVSSSSDTSSSSYELVVPNGVVNSSNGECTILVQIDPKDAKNFDFDGVIGAIGRLEADHSNNQIILDLKGQQYCGTLYPGPTAMVLSVVGTNYFESNNNTSSAALDSENQCKKLPQLKVESITNEFCKLSRRGDHMSGGFNATIKGDIAMNNDFFFRYDDDDVNRPSKNNDDEDVNVKNRSNKLKQKKTTASKSDSIKTPTSVSKTLTASKPKISQGKKKIATKASGPKTISKVKKAKPSPASKKLSKA